MMGMAPSQQKFVARFPSVVSSAFVLVVFSTIQVTNETND
jgi:xanthine/uracil permease